MTKNINRNNTLSDEQISEIEDETNIENILGLEKNIEKKSTENYGSAEDFVLKKIK